MTIFVFAPKGRVPLPLSKLRCIKSASTKPKFVMLVESEDKWGTTDFYCTTGALTSQLERRAVRLGAQIVYLPDMAKEFAERLLEREARGVDSRVRLAATADADTMAQLIAPPSLPLFPVGGRGQVVP